MKNYNRKLTLKQKFVSLLKYWKMFFKNRNMIFVYEYNKKKVLLLIIAFILFLINVSIVTSECQIESKKYENGSTKYYNTLEIVSKIFYKTKNRLLLEDKIDYYNSLLNQVQLAIANGIDQGIYVQEMNNVQNEIDQLRRITENESGIINSILISFEQYQNEYSLNLYVYFNDIEVGYNVAGGFEKSYSVILISDIDNSIYLPSAYYVDFKKDESKNYSISTLSYLLTQKDIQYIRNANIKKVKIQSYKGWLEYDLNDVFVVKRMLNCLFK